MKTLKQYEQQNMKKNIPLLIIAIAILLSSLAASAQKPTQKRDSIKFDTNEVKAIYRNCLIIQKNLHTLHIDGITRDKLDSLYNQSVTIFENKLKKPAITSGKKKP